MSYDHHIKTKFMYVVDIYMYIQHLSIVNIYFNTNIKEMVSSFHWSVILCPGFYLWGLCCLSV